MNKKIWNTSGVKVSDEISSFLAGEDIELDNSIFIYDIDNIREVPINISFEIPIPLDIQNLIKNIKKHS